MNKKIYQKSWFMWLMLIFVTPVGVFLLWKHSGFSSKAKMALSVAFSIWFVFMFITTQSDNNKTDNMAINNETAIENEQLEEETIEETSSNETDQQEKLSIEPKDIPGAYEIKHTETMEDYMYIFEGNEVRGKMVNHDLLTTKELTKEEMLQIAKYLESKDNVIEVVVNFYSQYDPDDTLGNLKNRTGEIALRQGKIVDLDSLGESEIKYLTDYEYLNK